MMDNIKVTIIIPVYNVEQYIVRCLQSVVAQENVADLEVILVDDCGTDNSIALAKEYLAGCAGLNHKILHHAKNGGLSAARNTGLRAATGDYVYFLDSDDEITPDCISLLAAPLKEKEYDFVIAGYSVLGCDLDYPPLILRCGEVLGNKRIIHSYSIGEWYMMAWNKLCNRRFLLDNSLFFEEGLLHEDVVWSFKLACKAISMFVVEQQTYNYYVRGESIMTGTSLDKDVDMYKAVFTYISRFVVDEDRTFDADIYNWVYGRLSSFMFSLLLLKNTSLFNSVYAFCHNIGYVSPLSAYRKGVVGKKYLIRDIHYSLPLFCGRVYKRLFYKLVYDIRKKKIEGALWRV